MGSISGIDVFHSLICSLDWLVHVSPQQWLIDVCKRAKKQNAVIGGLEDGNLVLKISDKIAVKYGYGVKPSEASTLRYAYQNLDPRIVRVPQVYRYFQDLSDPSWPIGYLFMEHISGQNLEDLDLTVDDISEQLANAISELQRVSGTDVPGPVGGGTIQGYLWGDNGTREIFSSVQDMNRWLNKRLKLIDKSIDLQPYPLVLCHLDLCRRNIKLTEDGTICLLDWGHAGFFPRFFEVAAVSCMNDDDIAYGESLLQAMTRKMALTDEEQGCVKLLLRARAASLRYLFEPLEGTGAPDIDSIPPLPPLNI